MTSLPAPRNRRRRRIVVTIAVLVLGWWYYPRGDARFVGKWMAADELDPTKPHSTFVLKINGTGMIDEGKAKCVFSWRVSGDELTMGTNSPTSWRPLLEKLNRWIAFRTNLFIFMYPYNYRIVEVEKDRLVIIDDDLVYGRNQILTRIPE